MKRTALIAQLKSELAQAENRLAAAKAHAATQPVIRFNPAVDVWVDKIRVTVDRLEHLENVEAEYQAQRLVDDALDRLDVMNASDWHDYNYAATSGKEWQPNRETVNAAMGGW